MILLQFSLRVYISGAFPHHCGVLVFLEAIHSLPPSVAKILGLGLGVYRDNTMRFGRYCDQHRGIANKDKGMSL